MRSFGEGRHLSDARLVENLSWLLVTERVDAGSLPRREHAKCGLRQRRREWQCLQTGDETVASEDRHEPRQAGGWQRAWRQQRVVAQRRKVNDAALVGLKQVGPIRQDPRCVGQSMRDAFLALFAGRQAISGAAPYGLGTADNADLESSRPFAVRLEPEPIRHAALIHARLRRDDPRLAHARLPPA